MSEKGVKRQGDSEFVCKLCDMLEKHPCIINWDQDGTRMVVYDTTEMENKVLPQYFRHSNFASFIRQLNMYNFHKLEREQDQQQRMIFFQHQIFKKGNERNYHFIQRKKKIKEQQAVKQKFQRGNQAILDRIKNQQKLQVSTKSNLQQLLQHKYTVVENLKKMKSQLDKVYTELKDCRTKKIVHALKEINGKLSEEINQQLIMAKNIDKLLENAFLSEQDKENKQMIANLEIMSQQAKFSNHIQSQYYSSVFTQDKYSLRDVLYDCNKFISKPSFVAFPSQCGLFNNVSVHSVHHGAPLFYSGPNLFSQLNYDHLRAQQEKQEIYKQQIHDDEDLSMDMVDEEDLKNLLNDQAQVKHEEQLKIQEKQ